jgi:hypothetical protein
MKQKCLIYVLIMASVAITLIANIAVASPDCDHPNFFIKGCDNPELIGATGATGLAGTPGATGPTGLQGPSGINGTTGIDGVNGVNGVNGADGTDGTNGVDSLSTHTVYKALFDDSRLVGGLAATAAIGMIPDAFDGRTAIGMGFTNYRGVEGIAIGVVHKVEGLNLKASIATSSGARDAVIGFGASTSF